MQTPAAFPTAAVLPCSMMLIFTKIILGIALLFFLLMMVAGLREKSSRCALVSFIFLSLTAASFVSVLYFPLHPVTGWATYVLPVLFLLFAVITLVKTPSTAAIPDMGSAVQFDERDHMFSRANLKYHPELMARYHQLRPEHSEIDQKIHRLPELLAPGGNYFDPAISPVADVAFAMLDRSYRALADIQPVENKVSPISADELLLSIRVLARRYSGADVGITALKPWHWYSHAGRQARNWGESIHRDHGTAVVIVVPMDLEMIRHAPGLPVIMESSRGYVNAAILAHQVTQLLCSHGYAAHANVDGNYEVICAPLAQHAGMGHVGRMGIFMHRVHGPCCRISVVTTDAPLPETTGNHGYMEDFCRVCKKCADNCPSRSITHGKCPTNRGFQHWSIDQENCYAFWRKVGTDCAVCIRSCPFSKPDTLIHKLARWYIRRNPVNRWLALQMDDLFYGRRLSISAQNPDFSNMQ